MKTLISRGKVLWVALFLGIILSGNAWGAPVLSKVNLPETISEGQEVPLQFVFEWPAYEGEYEIKPPQDVDVNNIKILGLSQSQETASSGSRPISRLTLSYRLLPGKPGQGSVLGFDVLYRNPTYGMWKKIPVPPVVMDIKSALPWKRILIMISIPIVLILPFALWFFKASRADRKLEEIFLSDPKQQLYADAANVFGSFVTGYTEALLRTILSGWSAELTKVVMTCYDIPIRHATKTEVLKELGAKKIPAGEFREIEDLFNKLEQLNFSTRGATGHELEKIRLSLLQYVKGKIIIGNL